jgi:NAD(P)-dependent dehydrogenase (short-subunit alcohol dehydrogenase family)
MDLPRTPSFRLDGKRALVTGASRGIGLGCAVALAEAGADVTLSARGAEALKDAAEAMRAAGMSADVLPMDVTDTQAVRTALEGRAAFDVLVNSAGLARHAPALQTSGDDVDAVMSANVKGAYFLAQAVAQRLAAAGKPGAILQISSQMGHVGGVDRAVYCASKHAVEGMTKAMAIEWGPLGIRVNNICPTFILTDLTRATFEDPDKRAWIESKIKLGRVGQVEDIMGACVFLASDAAALVTGASLLVDGGWTAG